MYICKEQPNIIQILLANTKKIKRTKVLELLPLPRYLNKLLIPMTLGIVTLDSQAQILIKARQQFILK